MDQYTPSDHRQGYDPYGRSAPPPPVRPAPRPKAEGNGCGIASMVCGCLALALFLLLVNVPLAIAAFVLGIIQIAGFRQKLFAWIGIVSAGLSMVLMIVGWVIIFRNVSMMDPDSLEQFRSRFEERYQFEIQNGDSL